MKKMLQFATFILVVGFTVQPFSSRAFEGRITVTITRSDDTQSLLYTVATNQLRIERCETDRPTARNIFSLETGTVTLLFPHNRSFVRLKPAAQNASTQPPGFPAMPAGLPPSICPQTTPTLPTTPPPHFGPTNLSGMPDLPQMPAPPAGLPLGIGSGVPPVSSGMGGMPAMSMMTPMMMVKAELTATGNKTNLLGYVCQKFELKQRGEVMEIWATDKLLPFQPYLQNQPPRFGPQMIEEQWGELLQAKKLFPLLAVLRFETPPVPGQTAPPPGPERLRFEVKSVTPEKITDETLFQPPPDYHEIQPLPF